MKQFFSLTVGIAIALGFLYLIYRFLPLGTAIAITGGCLATIKSETKRVDYVGAAGGWIYFAAVIFSFIKHGWVIGILSIILGFFAYRLAKER